MKHTPAPVEPVLVERQDQLEELCSVCRGERRFAFDTEFVMEDRYETEVCLVQVASAQQVWLVDPFLKLNLEPFWQLVCDPGVETVVHAGQEDLGLAARATGAPPRNVYDVQIAAGLAGYDFPMSLQKLAQAVLHVRLHKTKTLTNWRKRPLAASQLQYAAEDVVHLLPVRDKLHARLSQRKRTDWAREEFAKFEEPSLYKMAEREKLFRLKGSGALRGRQLAVLSELLSWRERLAQQRNRPARTVVKDHVMIEIAKLGLTGFSEIRDLRGLNLSDRDVHALCRVAREAAAIPEPQWPQSPPREVESPGESILVALLTAVLRSYSIKQEIAYGLIATKKSLTDLIRGFRGGKLRDRADIELMNGWRGKTVGRIVHDILAGKSVLRVADMDGEPVVEVTQSA